MSRIDVYKQVILHDPDNDLSTTDAQDADVMQ